MTIEEFKKLPPLSIPITPIKLVEDESHQLSVFDPLRKKWLRLTPEEYVRQNFVQWLIAAHKYPASLMQNEVSLTVNDMKKRTDTIAFDREGRPLLIVEYKAPTINITQEVFDQIYRYNLSLKVKYLIVSNGRNHYCCKMDYLHDTYHFIPKIPTFHEAAGLPHEN